MGLATSCAPTVDKGTPSAPPDPAPPADSGDTAPPPDTDTPAAPPPVRINELMAKNQSLVQEPDGSFADWIELVNMGDADLSLEGWTLAVADAAAPLPPGLRIAPSGHVRLRLADAGGDLALALSSGGGTVRLLDATGLEVDVLSWPSLGADIAWGRFPDGAAFVAPTIWATPGASNPVDPGLDLDPSSRLFPSHQVLNVEVELDAAARASLAAEPTRDVPGALTVDGVRLATVGVRIKGQIGSYRPLDDKPALRMNLDWAVDGQRLRGLETFTLNNMVQDSSYVHEVLVYRLLREAGVPAPRTAWAFLSINGEPKGIYLHVESVDDQFLDRWFDDPTGDMWEGEYGQDLTWGSFETLDLDELGADGIDDRAELAALADLLTLPPSESHVPALEALVDVDAWALAMAAEVMVGHWDGYFYYPNNYRVYHEPSRDQLYLIPWGVDQTLDWWGDPYAPNGALARWMLEVPSLRRRYDLALWELSQQMAALPAGDEVARARSVLGPLLDSAPYAPWRGDWIAWMDAAEAYMPARSEAMRAALFPEGEP